MTLLQFKNLPESPQVKNFENWSTFGEVTGKSLVSWFFVLTQCIYNFSKKYIRRAHNKQSSSNQTLLIRLLTRCGCIHWNNIQCSTTYGLQTSVQEEHPSMCFSVFEVSSEMS